MNLYIEYINDKHEYLTTQVSFHTIFSGGDIK